MPETNSPVVIIGAGWAGLAAAVELCKSGKNVTLYESARQPGGRARCAPFGAHKVDNGQHLMIGAYHYMLKIMGDIGLDSESLFSRYPVNLQLYDTNGVKSCLKTNRLPSPLHILSSLFSSQGISLSEHLAIIKLFLKIRGNNFILDKDISVARLLHGQPSSLCHKLWYPLCIASLNTPAENASAKLFMRVLHDSFMHRASDSDLLIPKVDLGQLFPEPAVDYIEIHGGQLHLAMRASELIITDNVIEAVIVGDEKIMAQQVIIATSHHQATSLLDGHPLLKPMADKLRGIETQPICTVYLQYPAEIQLDFPMTGLLGTTSQWVFDRRVCNQPGMMAVVISANGAHMQIDKETLARLVADELAHRYPHWPEPEATLVIREKRATFSATVGIDRHRPTNETPVTGLWLAGDYTAIGYPATLEAAVRSGVQCAHRIMQSQEE